MLICQCMLCCILGGGGGLADAGFLSVRGHLPFALGYFPYSCNGSTQTYVNNITGASLCCSVQAEKVQDSLMLLLFWPSSPHSALSHSVQPCTIPNSVLDVLAPTDLCCSAGMNKVSGLPSIEPDLTPP